MNVEYKRDLQNNYLIMEVPQQEDADDYHLRMAEQNSIPGLLPLHSARKDGVLYLHYEITSKQPLGSIFEKRLMGYEDIFFLLAGIRDALESMQKFLLDPAQLVFDPEYLYVDFDHRKVQLCYLPGSGGHYPITQLAEFILKRLDHKEQQAVALGYDFYQRATEDNFSLQRTLRESLAMEDGDGSEMSRSERNRNPCADDVPSDHRGRAADAGAVSANSQGRMAYGSDASSDYRGRMTRGNDASSDYRGRMAHGGDASPDYRGRMARGSDASSDYRGRMAHGGDASSDYRGHVAYDNDASSNRRGRSGNSGEAYPLREDLFEEAEGISPELCETYQVTHRERRRRKQGKVDKLFQLIHPAVLLSTLLLLVVLEVVFSLGMLTVTEAGGVFFLLISVEALINKFWKASKEKKRESRWADEDDDEMYRQLQEEMYEAPEESSVIEETQCLTSVPEQTGIRLVCTCTGAAGFVGQDIYVGSEPVYVGKIKGESDVILDSPTVSRRHARLECRDGVCYVKDLNSRNGTFCNGRRLHPQEQCAFTPGDEIAFAEIGYRAVIR